VKVIACIDDPLVIKKILDHLSEKAEMKELTPCPRAVRRQPACSADIKNQPFDSRSCAVSPRRGHDLADDPAGAADAKKRLCFIVGTTKNIGLEKWYREVVHFAPNS